MPEEVRVNNDIGLHKVPVCDAVVMQSRYERRLGVDRVQYLEETLGRLLERLDLTSCEVEEILNVRGRYL